ESNSVIWDEVSQFNQPKKVEHLFNSIDSSFNENTLFQAVPFPALVFSLLKSEDDALSYLIQWRKFSEVELMTYIDFISNSLHLKKVISENKNEFTLTNGKDSYFGILNNGVVSIGNSLKVVHSLAETGSSSILANNSFTTVRKTSSKNVKSRLFVKATELTKSMEKFMSERTQLDIHLFPETSSWIELDLDIKPDEISMGGFAIANDSLNHWISIFKNQEPMKPTIFNYLPNQTAFVLHYGFSNFRSLRERMVKRNSEMLGSDFNQPIIQWDSVYDISIENDFLNWIENEVAISIIEPERVNVKSEALVWVNSSDAMTMMSHLKEMALHIDNKELLDFRTISYKNYEIQKLNIPNFLNSCLGNSFSVVNENYFTQIEDFIVFSNSPATLQWCIDRYENGKTMSTDESFKNFTNRISGTSNLFLYSNISKSINIYSHLASSELKNEINENLEFFQKFQGIAIQVSHESDELYYVNNFIKYNPINKKMPNTIWETPISNPSSFKPVILKNHYTNAKEIFIQDTANVIYLIDSKGNILWHKNIEESIQSEVTQVDIYNNGKLQIAFSTLHYIYVLDRNGNYVTNYPISLPEAASAPMLIADYDNTNNIRFLIPSVGGDVLNYSSTGLPTKGWKYEKSTTRVTQKLAFVKVNKKDYLITIFEDGTIKALNRRGETRIKLKSKLNFSPKFGYILEKGNNLASTYILTMTKKQDIVRISLSDEKENLFSISTDSVAYINYSNIDDNPQSEIITVGNNKITSYTIDNQQISRYSLRQKVSFPPYVYQFAGRKLLGFVSSSKNKIYLADQKGELISPFPLKGASPFTITDINNDGRLNLLTIDTDGILFNYTLE
ncbi:MAG: hypothetical protein ACI85Q_002813, partial [Salibacteraceae bacterium]